MTSWKRLLLLGAVASAALTAAIAIAVLLFGDFGETEGRILGTTFALAVASLLALPGSILLERRVAVPLGWATIGLAAASFALTLFLLWIDDSSTTARLLGTAAAFAAATTQTAALTPGVRRDDDRRVRAAYVAALANALVLAAMVTIAVWSDGDNETFFRALAALAVLDVFLVVLQPLLRRLGRGRDEEERVVLEGTREEIADALRRLEGSGVRVRR